MDFGDILDAWEKRSSDKKSRSGETRTRRERELMEQWLESEEAWQYYDKGEDFQEPEPGSRRSRLRHLPPEEHIDLHGLTREEALRRLDRFLRTSVQRGLEKVLIVHGKGNHSAAGAVLRDAVRDHLRASPLAGETGHPGRELGGSGATWVLLKRGS
jgi:DNA-nicking Smr family endonuclease